MSEYKGFGAGQIFLAFLGGAAAGAAVALFTAQKTGRETRAQLGGYLHAGREKTLQLPQAVKAASVAARDAFTETMSETH
jgi:gas vesicle protein